MTYLVLDVVFLAVAGAVVALAHARGVRPSLRAIAWSMLVLAVMTLVFDNLMIAAGLFEFDDAHLVGLRVGRAPVEDLGYPFAVALLLPALWHLLGRRRGAGAGGVDR
ncbi:MULTISPECIES: lycopene cyclase domain-containing protein [unclassified Actinotalea]|uniref:lycopene cyclase domain-containing protein n=1 Tax=unclassified Actinotalea TaxID=2638618 RepID=UPI0015F3B241|nr:MULTISPECIES: lycopene cyclase domain-containing protein [unclassified Actinotalea]